MNRRCDYLKDIRCIEHTTVGKVTQLDKHSLLLHSLDVPLCCLVRNVKPFRSLWDSDNQGLKDQISHL